MTTGDPQFWRDGCGNLHPREGYASNQGRLENDGKVHFHCSEHGEYLDGDNPFTVCPKCWSIPKLKKNRKKLICILKWDVPNKNGNVYSRNSKITIIPKNLVVHKSIDDIRRNILSNIVGEIELVIKKDGLYCKPTWLTKEALELLNDKSVSVRTSGYGQIENGVVTDYTIESTFLTNDPA